MLNKLGLMGISNLSTIEELDENKTN